MQWRRRVEWTPNELDWWIAALFIAGSLLFLVGSFPPYSQLVDGRLLGTTFVVGSVFFTAAAYIAVIEVINDGSDASTPRKLWAWSPRGALWWAAVIQLVGALLFNVNTIDALFSTFTVEETNRLVWAPDIVGCMAFLLASHISWMQLSGRFWFRNTDDAAWWSSMFNYIGSGFFMTSAIAAFTLKTTGEAINIAIVNTGTSFGAICFLVGSYVLLPPADHKPQDR